MMSSIHRVLREQYHTVWDNSIPPILTVDSGDVVEFDALDASGGQLGPSSVLHDLVNLSLKGCNPVNGPIYVRDAEPGDTLQVDFLALHTADWGWTGIFPGFGLLADHFTEPALKIWHLEGDYAEFKPGIRIPIEPFCGEIGVAPAATGSFSTIPPSANGGNIDTKHITVGSTVYLPVFVPGALFSVGDGHAAQGDGEVCGTAIETPMKVQLRLSVKKDMPISELQYITGGPLCPRTNSSAFYATTGCAPDLMQASRKAILNMIDYLQKNYSLSRTEAYMLCSVAVDLKISEVVDAPNWIVGAYLPLSIFQN